MDGWIVVNDVVIPDDEERPILDDKWFKEADAYSGGKLVEKGSPSAVAVPPLVDRIDNS